MKHTFLICMVVLLAACSAPKEVLYLQDISLIKEEAIDKLTDLFNGDISGVTDRIDAMSNLAREYKSFAGISDGVSGTTKFIIETEGIDD